MPSAADLKAALDALQAGVAAENDVVTSAITLLGNLSQALKDALANSGTPQEALDEVATIAATIDAKKAELADAVVANTPAAP